MLACGRRASEIHGLSGLPSDFLRERDGAYALRFRPEFLAKNQPPESTAPSIRFRPSHTADVIDSDVRLCPVRALHAFVKRTKERRQCPLRRLFLPVADTRHQDVTKSALARWISSVIIDAYSAASLHVAVRSSTSGDRRGGARESDSA